MQTKRYQNFKEFYAFYLSQHSHPTCRLLHVFGSLLSILFILFAIFFQSFWWVLAAVLVGYAFAWLGHFKFEKNKPATFQQPFYSFMADFVMLVDYLRGKFK